MDWKAQLTSSIEAAVQSAVERSLQPAIEDIMRVYTDASKQRLHRQTTEIRDALSAGVHKRGCFDPEPVKPQATVVLGNDLDMASSHGVALAATAPATCSIQYPSRAVTVLVPALAYADVYSILPIRDSEFEESVDERTRRLRHRIQLAEDRARRDPVWAEKMARRHAAFRDTTMVTSISTAPASILTACAVRDGDLDLASPTTCSSLCPGGNTSVVAASMVLGEAAVTTACTACDGCVYPVSQPVVMPTPVPVDVADCALTMAAPSEDMFPIALMLSEVSIFQPLKPFSDWMISACVQWPAPLDMCVNLPRDFLEHDNQMQCKEEKKLVNIPAAANQATSWIESRPISQVGTVLLSNLNGGSITNEHKVALPLKLMEMPTLETKFLNMSPLLPQSALATVSWDTSMHQLQAKFSCSSRNCDTHQTPGYTSNQLQLPWLVQLSCSSENAIDNKFCQDVCMELLLYQFNRVGLFCQQHMEHHVALASTYLAICTEKVAIEDCRLGSFSHVQWIFQPRHLEASEYLSPAAYSVPYQCAPVTAGMVVPYSSVSLWEFAWSNLFYILRAIQNISELWSCILCSRTAVLLLFVYGKSTQKGPMEQWDPGIARTVDITQYCQVTCHLISTAAATELAQKKILQDRFQPYTNNYALLHGHAYIRTAGFVMDRVSPSLPDYLLQSCDTGHIYCGGSASFSSEVLAIGNPGRRLLSVRSFLDMGLFRTNHKLMAHIFDVVNLLSRVQDVPLFLKLVKSSEQGDTFRGSFLSLVSLVLLGAKLQLSWDPGGRKFLGFFTQAEAKGRRNAVAPAYYSGHCLDYANYFDKVCADQDYYLDVFHDQAHIGHDYDSSIFLEQVCTVRYINLIKVCLDYGIHHDLGEVMKHQVPWDPGGLTWHRLEVKPKFKEGRMLATNLPSPGLGLVLLGLGCTGWIHYKYRVNAYEQLGLELDGFGLHRFCLLFLSCFPSPV